MAGWSEEGNPNSEKLEGPYTSLASKNVIEQI
jgi:hypothetical protein